jgi:NDP-sugar pyrophosphorylase family protein
MYATHMSSLPLATLAVNHRQTSRHLLFDINGLCGRYDKQSGRGAEVHVQCEEVQQFAFAGVHIVSPRLLGMFTETGAFSIIETYLRLAGAGERIEKYDMGSCLWLDIGTPERLARAREWAERQR